MSLSLFFFLAVNVLLQIPY